MMVRHIRLDRRANFTFSRGWALIARSVMNSKFPVPPFRTIAKIWPESDSVYDLTAIDIYLRS
jgi:hypothetical protein